MVGKFIFRKNGRNDLRIFLVVENFILNNFWSTFFERILITSQGARKRAPTKPNSIKWQKFSVGWVGLCDGLLFFQTISG